MVEDPHRDALDAARILVLRGREAEGLTALADILIANPAHEAALLLKGELLLEAHRDQEALETARAAVTFWPDSSESRNGLARCLHAIGEHEMALAEADRAKGMLGLGSNVVQTGPVYLTIVWCFRALGRLGEALAAAEEGLARCPDAILAHWAQTVEEELARAQTERCE
jgi:tetratricopeptide (TPR) repeat protein